MYDCDKGYVLEEGPPGATCVGGRWRPTELPKCLPGQHPRLRFNRKRRSIEMRYRRSTFLLKHARRLQKWMEENLQENIHSHRRTKRSIFRFPFGPSARYVQKRIRRSHPTLRFKRKAIHYDEQLFKRTPDPLNQAVYRGRREPDEMARAYSKFYEKLKQRYQNYVKNLLGYHQGRTPSVSSPQSSSAHRNNNPTKKIQVQDGRWYNTYNSPDFVTRYKVTHKTRIAGSDLDSDEESYLDSFNELQPPTSAPKVHMNAKLAKKEQLSNGSALLSSVHDTSRTSIQQSDRLGMLSGQKLSTQSSASKNLTNLIAQLKSQIVRRKRSADTEGGGDQDHAENRKPRPRGPCEELNLDAVANVTIVRQGKSPGRNSPGTILHIVCNTGFKLNIKNPNATARCVRGIWKPQKPMCLSGEF